MPGLRRWIALILMAALLLGTPASTYAQTAAERFFPETGHWVTGEFLTFYDLVGEPSLVYGSPITDAFRDPLTGYTVQYFTYARFELDPAAMAGKQVRLSPLGWLLYEPGPEVPLETDTPACRSFMKTGAYVCHALLEFYDSHGGQAVFGDPVADLENHAGLYVQSFERARFEWHPELPAGKRVTLSPLGRIYFYQRGNDPALLKPVLKPDTPLQLVQLKARAFVTRAVVAPNSRQSLLVIAQDQYLLPVEGAEVKATVRFPNGSEETHRLPLTDGRGVSVFEFLVTDQEPDTLIEIQVEVAKSGLVAGAKTGFRVWW